MRTCVRVTHCPASATLDLDRIVRTVRAESAGGEPRDAEFTYAERTVTFR